MKTIFFAFFLISISFSKVFAIKIIGKFNDNFPISKKVRLYYIDRILNIDKTLTSVDLNANGNFEINFDLKKPGVYFLNQTIVYITNSDSVSIIISNDKIIESKGRNSGNYLYYSQIRPYYSSRKKNNLIVNVFDINQVLEDSKNKCITINMEISSLDISEEFRKYIYSDVWFETLDYYLNSLNNNRILINLNQIELRDNNNNSYFQNQLIYSIINALNISSDSIQSNTDWLLKLKLYSNFSQFYKEVILQIKFQSLIREKPHSFETFNFGKQCNDFFSDETVSELFIKNWILLEKLTQQIPAEVRNTKFKDYYGQEVTFENILKKYSDKFVYMDIWAKWCGACIYEFPMIKDLKHKYSSSNLETVGISIDNEFLEFQKAADKYNLNIENQYYLANDNNNEFKTYFSIEELPKYFIFNKEGRPLNFESIRPNNKKLDKLLSKYMDLKQVD